ADDLREMPHFTAKRYASRRKIDDRTEDLCASEDHRDWQYRPGSSRSHDNDQQCNTVRDTKGTEMTRRVRLDTVLLAEHQRRDCECDDLDSDDRQHDSQDAPVRGAVGSGGKLR